MADDYDFDDDFADEDLQQSYKQPATKKPDANLVKKQSFGNKKPNDGFESFDMEDVKDDFNDSNPKSKKPTGPAKDVKPQIKEKVPDSKPLSIPAKDQKTVSKKNNDDSEDFEIDDDTFGKKKENKAQSKPESQQKPELSLPKSNKYYSQ